jgi:ABC-type polar amino acid transport system ATPase subunit
MILITHRLRLAMIADQVLFMQGGISWPVAVTPTC